MMIAWVNKFGRKDGIEEHCPDFDSGSERSVVKLTGQNVSECVSFPVASPHC